MLIELGQVCDFRYPAVLYLRTLKNMASKNFCLKKVKRSYFTFCAFLANISQVRTIDNYYCYKRHHSECKNFDRRHFVTAKYVSTILPEFRIFISHLAKFREHPSPSLGCTFFKKIWMKIFLVSKLL